MACKIPKNLSDPAILKRNLLPPNSKNVKLDHRQEIIEGINFSILRRIGPIDSLSIGESIYLIFGEKGSIIHEYLKELAYYNKYDIPGLKSYIESTFGMTVDIKLLNPKDKSSLYITSTTDVNTLFSLLPENVVSFKTRDVHNYTINSNRITDISKWVEKLENGTESFDRATHAFSAIESNINIIKNKFKNELVNTNNIKDIEETYDLIWEQLHKDDTTYKLRKPPGNEVTSGLLEHYSKVVDYIKLHSSKISDAQFNKVSRSINNIKFFLVAHPYQSIGIYEEILTNRVFYYKESINNLSTSNGMTAFGVAAFRDSLEVFDEDIEDIENIRSGSQYDESLSISKDVFSTPSVISRFALTRIKKRSLNSKMATKTPLGFYNYYSYSEVVESLKHSFSQLHMRENGKTMSQLFREKLDNTAKDNPIAADLQRLLFGDVSSESNEVKQTQLMMRNAVMQQFLNTDLIPVVGVLTSKLDTFEGTEEAAMYSSEEQYDAVSEKLSYSSNSPGSSNKLSNIQNIWNAEFTLSDFYTVDSTGNIHIPVQNVQNLGALVISLRTNNKTIKSGLEFLGAKDINITDNISKNIKQPLTDVLSGFYDYLKDKSIKDNEIIIEGGSKSLSTMFPITPLMAHNNNMHSIKLATAGKEMARILSSQYAYIPTGTYTINNKKIQAIKYYSLLEKTNEQIRGNLHDSTVMGKTKDPIAVSYNTTIKRQMASGDNISILQSVVKQTRLFLDLSHKKEGVNIHKSFDNIQDYERLFIIMSTFNQTRYRVLKNKTLSSTAVSSVEYIIPQSGDRKVIPFVTGVYLNTNSIFSVQEATGVIGVNVNNNMSTPIITAINNIVMSNAAEQARWVAIYNDAVNRSMEIAKETNIAKKSELYTSFVNDILSKTSKNVLPLNVVNAYLSGAVPSEMDYAKDMSSGFFINYTVPSNSLSYVLNEIANTSDINERIAILKSSIFDFGAETNNILQTISNSFTNYENILAKVVVKPTASPVMLQRYLSKEIVPEVYSLYNKLNLLGKNVVLDKLKTSATGGNTEASVKEFLLDFVTNYAIFYNDFNLELGLNNIDATNKAKLSSAFLKDIATTTLENVDLAIINRTKRNSQVLAAGKNFAWEIVPEQMVAIFGEEYLKKNSEYAKDPSKARILAVDNFKNPSTASNENVRRTKINVALGLGIVSPGEDMDFENETYLKKVEAEIDAYVRKKGDGDSKVKVLKSFENSEIMDGAVFASSEETIRLLAASNAFTADQLKVLRDLYTRDMTAKEADTLLKKASLVNPMKLTMAGLVDMVVKLNTSSSHVVNTNVYNKCAVFPLPLFLAKGTELELLSKIMNENQIDYVVPDNGAKRFQPAFKFNYFSDTLATYEQSNTPLNEYYNNAVTNESINTKLIGSAVYTIDRQSIFEQQSIADDSSGVKASVQSTKQIGSNLNKDFMLETGTSFEDGGSHVSMHSTEFRQLRKDVFDRLFETEKAKLYKELGIDVKNNTIKDTNLLYKRLYEIISIERSRGVTFNDLDIFSANGTTVDINIPLSLINNPKALESVLSAYISNNLIKISMPGNHFVQLPSSFTSGGRYSKIRKYDKQNLLITKSGWDPSQGLRDMEYVREVNEKGETVFKMKPAQVIMTWNIKDENGKLLDYKQFLDAKGNIDISKIDPALLTGVTYRTPLQDLNFMSTIEIVAFLPPSVNNTIYIPDAFSVRMGSDFDIDSLYIYGYHTKVTKANNRISRVERIDRIADSPINWFKGKAYTNYPTDLDEKSKWQQNQLTDLFMLRLNSTDEITRQQMTATSTEKPFGDAIKIINDLKKVNQESFNSTTSDKNKVIVQAHKSKSSLSIEEDMNRRNIMFSGKHGVAIAASIGILQTYLQEYGITLSDTYNLTYNKGDITSDVIDTVTIGLLNKLKNMDNDLITSVISNWITIAVDNGKLGYLGELNLHSGNIAVAITLTRLGLRLMDVLYIINHPIIVEYDMQRLIYKSKSWLSAGKSEGKLLRSMLEDIHNIKNIDSNITPENINVNMTELHLENIKDDIGIPYENFIKHLNSNSAALEDKITKLSQLLKIYSRIVVASNTIDSFANTYNLDSKGLPPSFSEIQLKQLKATDFKNDLLVPVPINLSGATRIIDNEPLIKHPLMALELSLSNVFASNPKLFSKGAKIYQHFLKLLAPNGIVKYISKDNVHKLSSIVDSVLISEAFDLRMANGTVIKEGDVGSTQENMSRLLYGTTEDFNTYTPEEFREMSVNFDYVFRPDKTVQSYIKKHSVLHKPDLFSDNINFLAKFIVNEYLIEDENDVIGMEFAGKKEDIINTITYGNVSDGVHMLSDLMNNGKYSSHIQSIITTPLQSYTSHKVINVITKILKNDKDSRELSDIYYQQAHTKLEADGKILVRKTGDVIVDTVFEELLEAFPYAGGNVSTYTPNSLVDRLHTALSNYGTPTSTELRTNPFIMMLSIAHGNGLFEPSISLRSNFNLSNTAVQNLMYMGFLQGITSNNPVVVDLFQDLFLWAITVERGGFLSKGINIGIPNSLKASILGSHYTTAVDRFIKLTEDSSRTKDIEILLYRNFPSMAPGIQKLTSNIQNIPALKDNPIELQQLIAKINSAVTSNNEQLIISNYKGHLSNYPVIVKYFTKGGVKFMVRTENNNDIIYTLDVSPLGSTNSNILETPMDPLAQSNLYTTVSKADYNANRRNKSKAYSRVASIKKANEVFVQVLGNKANTMTFKEKSDELDRAVMHLLKITNSVNNVKVRNLLTRVLMKMMDSTLIITADPNVELSVAETDTGYDINFPDLTKDIPIEIMLEEFLHIPVSKHIEKDDVSKDNMNVYTYKDITSEDVDSLPVLSSLLAPTTYSDEYTDLDVFLDKVNEVLTRSMAMHIAGIQIEIPNIENTAFLDRMSKSIKTIGEEILYGIYNAPSNDLVYFSIGCK